MYQIIYADPPWSYKDKAAAGQRGASFKYPVMSIEDICALKVKDQSAEDATLFLWVTFPMIFEGLKVLEAWGFRYKTVAFVWVKRNKKADTNFWGMGNWTRANAEIVLLGVKGKPKRVSPAVHQIVNEPLGRHSEKPNEVRERGLLS